MPWTQSFQSSVMLMCFILLFGVLRKEARPCSQGTLNKVCFDEDCTKGGGRSSHSLPDYVFEDLQCAHPYSGKLPGREAI